MTLIKSLLGYAHMKTLHLYYINSKYVRQNAKPNRENKNKNNKTDNVKRGVATSRTQSVRTHSTEQTV